MDAPDAIGEPVADQADEKAETMIARPGKMTTHGAVSMKLRVSAIIKPHSGVGG